MHFLNPTSLIETAQVVEKLSLEERDVLSSASRFLEAIRNRSVEALSAVLAEECRIMLFKDRSVVGKKEYLKIASREDRLTNVRMSNARVSVYDNEATVSGFFCFVTRPRRMATLLIILKKSEIWRIVNITYLT